MNENESPVYPANLVCVLGPFEIELHEQYAKMRLPTFAVRTSFGIRVRRGIKLSNLEAVFEFKDMATGESFACRHEKIKAIRHENGEPIWYNRG